MRRLRYILNKWLRKVVRMNDSPESIATGASIGMFVAMIPIYGFQILTAVALAAVSRVNKLAAALPPWVTNPFTIPPVLYVQYHIGRLVIGSEEVVGVRSRIARVAEAVSEMSIFEFGKTTKAVFIAVRNLGWDVLWPTAIGSLISGLLMGLITYPLTFRAVIWYRCRRERRRSLRRDRLAEYLSERAPTEAGSDETLEELAPPGP